VPTEGDKRGDRVIAASAATGASGAPSSQLSKLFELAIRQIAEGRLDSPTGDNALETYRQVAALSPEERATTELGTTLSVALWRLANNAKEAELWDESLRYFARLRELPPVPLVEISRHPAAPSLPAGAVASPVSATAVSESERSEVDTFSMERGDELLRQRDVVGARHFYQRAALGGDAVAATALARTYDPLFLSAKGIRATLGDPFAAEHWYEAAIERGDATAATHLDRLRSSRESRLR
jgi:hypothetical protein